MYFCVTNISFPHIIDVITLANETQDFKKKSSVSCKCAAWPIPSQLHLKCSAAVQTGRCCVRQHRFCSLRLLFIYIFLWVDKNPRVWQTAVFAG